MSKYYIEPELQDKIIKIIEGKLSFKDKEYQKIIKELWGEYLLFCKEDTKISKDRDKIIDMIQKW